MATPFTVIIPKMLTEGNLVSSTIPETDYGVWNSGTTYSVGQRVDVTTGVHKIYESLQGTNLNHSPTTSPTWWVEVGPTNRWAMFDESGGTYSYSSGANIVISFTMDRATSIALIELTARSVRIQATAPGYPNYYDQKSNHQKNHPYLTQ